MIVTLESLVDLHKIIPKLVIDVGGYNGDYADIINKKFDCEIIIYEPILAYYSKISERFKNDKNIHVVPVAASRKTGVRKMYVSEVASSFFQSWNQSTKTEDVSTVRLSDEIQEKKVDILKLNCEGAEYEIIDDLDEHNLLKDIDEILVQFHKVMRREKTEATLSKTHEKVFDFKWQLWVKK